MRLSHLLTGLDAGAMNHSDPEISGVCYDSRKVQPGDCFVAIVGEHTDGHIYAAGAIAAGAAAVVAQRPLDGVEPLVLVPNSRRALALLAAEFYGHPARDLIVIGVTGTDGKTTTAILIHQMLRAAGRRVGTVDTVDIRLDDEVQVNETRQTTLEALEIQALLARMRDSGIRYAVIETSSHGIAMDRVVGCEYDIAVFTNIAHEHLDFHGSFDTYRQIKGSLIDMAAAAIDKGVAKTAILNRDDHSFEYLAARPIGRRLSYGAGADADCRLLLATPSARGLRVQSATPAGRLELQLQLAGKWNAHNALAAVAVGMALELPREQIRSGLEAVATVPGRMQRVELSQPYQVVIDYAHTPQSLEKVLTELRTMTTGKLIVVFGSAGERDTDKRPQMGAIAARLSDYAVFTNEDPREEDAQEIIREIATGAEAEGWRDGDDFARIEDRAQAIAHAIAMTRPGDTVLLAGKGHEGSIFIGKEKLKWDERAAAVEAITRSR